MHRMGYKILYSIVIGSSKPAWDNNQFIKDVCSMVGRLSCGIINYSLQQKAIQQAYISPQPYLSYPTPLIHFSV